jgi:DNA-binding transcriptional MocR family regulator
VDETFVELGLTATPPAPTAALDRSVLTVGSLSKPFWAGLRVGWIRAPEEMVTRLAAARAVVDIGSPTIEQLAAAHVFTELDTIVAARRAQLLPRRDALLAALATRLPGWQPLVPVGGMSTWIELDAPLATALATTAGSHGVRVVPGARFAVPGTMERFLRLPFTLPPAELGAAVDGLAQAWHALDPAAAVPSPLIVA